MLLNLHKKTWMDGLTLQDYDEHCSLNQKTVKVTIRGGCGRVCVVWGETGWGSLDFFMCGCGCAALWVQIALLRMYQGHPTRINREKA